MLLVGLALALMHIIETKLQVIRVSYVQHCITSCFHFSSHLKQLYISNKTDHFSYKGGCGIYGHMHFRLLKEELVWTMYKTSIHILIYHIYARSVNISILDNTFKQRHIYLPFMLPFVSLCRRVLRNYIYLPSFIYMYSSTTCYCVKDV